MPEKDNLTEAQATQLIRYLLGNEFRAVPAAVGLYAIFRSNALYSQGASWREAFRSAGAPWPARPQFIHRGLNILMGSNIVATCRSATFAKRASNALNAYQPNAKGE